MAVDLKSEGSNVANTRVNELATQLRRDIALGVLAPGTRLNIEALKRDRKVSHPTIRETLALLAGEGYVTVEENKGYRVLASSLDDLRDSTRLRAELECLGFAWAMERATPEWRGQVVAAHHMLSEVEANMGRNLHEFILDWDIRNKAFHMALIAACGSPRLIETVSTLYDLTRRYRLMAYSTHSPDRPAWVERSPREHDRLKDCALAGDVENGVSALREHITKSFSGADGALSRI